MEEDKILISRELYDELSSAFEKVEAADRLYQNSLDSVSVGQLMAVLGCAADREVNNTDYKEED